MNSLSNAFPRPVSDLNSLGPNVVVDAAGGNFFEHLDFHLDYAPFRERAVREAVITAINRPRIVAQAYLGKSSVLDAPVPPTVWFSLQNPDFAANYPATAAKWQLPIYKYDPDKANRILDTAGWLRGPDGVRAKGGIRLEFELAATQGAPLREISTRLIQQDLKAIGLQANLKYYSSDEYFGFNGAIDREQCQLCEFAWAVGPEGGFDVWQSQNIPRAAAPDGSNLLHYANTKFDEAVDLFYTEVSRTTRSEYAAQAQVTLMQDIALIPLFPRRAVVARNTSVRNYKPDFGGDMWWCAAGWYIDR